MLLMHTLHPSRLCTGPTVEHNSSQADCTLKTTSLSHQFSSYHIGAVISSVDLVLVFLPTFAQFFIFTYTLPHLCTSWLTFLYKPLVTNLDSRFPWTVLMVNGSWCEFTRLNWETEKPSTYRLPLVNEDGVCFVYFIYCLPFSLNSIWTTQLKTIV